MYVLASHGTYAEATLASCELIAGKLPNFTTVSFHDPMSIADLTAAYATAFSKETDPASYTIITDIPNGSPANAALQFKHEHPEIHIFSGLSLALVLALATGTPMGEALTQSKSIIKELSLHDDRADALKQVSTNQSSAINNTGNPLINVRVDARLIHGQVATMWTRTLNATRIMVVDDQIVKSEVQKMTLKTAVPGGVHLSILTSVGAAKRILADQYQGQRVFLIVRNPKALQEMVAAGVKFDTINVGNLSMAAGAKQVAKSVAVTPADVAIFDYLTEHGIKLYHQMVPNDPKVDFMPLLNKGV
ncbi:PTS mannose/fructose/sorbose transporter subunit EIIAB [Lacticaseibacillus chiayiensis]|uniref:PTS mannose/fructose/sorbose transporter subunit EIIAB n=1 Tax=Lacticaseibacillus chiayiensis TaxID=2100821 RepID=A0A4Q1U5Z5_9LACO|nr:PTS mannose/fructose/sorbose transporter subunit IIAB [Lacticaseibacillus chiayiensis]QVI34484.1 PTS sugar transporter subunit IIB [Lacticaseibacillus chiayiensis]RXT27006.1 PTS mannose/fructose/sorbose transporter subunit EIIAB [Lacticaseibacillus chiayiensis]UYN56219.1 PTS sugar transporter subunit IIB [Lacticaseibacillus chiayiensis]